MRRSEAQAVNRICDELLANGSDAATLLDALMMLAEGAFDRLGDGWSRETVVDRWVELGRDDLFGWPTVTVIEDVKVKDGRV